MREVGRTSSEVTDDRQGPPWSTSPFGNIGVLVGVVASLSIIVSFVHDWGFFFALGTSFAQAPTTITDHMQTWLIWLPILVMLGVAVAARELFLLRVERGMTEEELISTAPHPKIIGAFRKSAQYLVPVSCTLVVVVWIMFGGIFFSVLFLCLAVCWFLFAEWVFRHKVVNVRTPHYLKVTFLWLPTVLSIVFGIGVYSAETIGNSSMSHRLVIDGKADVTETVEVEVLRAFEEWLLIRDVNKRLSWIRLDEVKRMELLEGAAPFKGLLCTFSERWCSRTE